MRKILFFSNNIHKLKEIKKLTTCLKIKLYSPNDFELKKEPKENGNSFAENSKIKSLFGYKKIKLPCFADDSGICIEALKWGPGISSKKFICSFSSEKNCFDYIFNKVKKTGKNKAYFQTSICYTLREDYHIIFEGKVKGHISNKYSGKHGFGYDPIFIPDGYKKTFGEIKSFEKNRISHRAIAINKFIDFINY